MGRSKVPVPNAGSRTAMGASQIRDLQYLNMRLFQSREELLKLEVSRDMILDSIRYLQGHMASLEDRIREMAL